MASPQVRLHVAVASEHPLIGEAVATALRGRGFDVSPLAWPGDVVPAPRKGEPADVGLLVCDLDRWSRLHTVSTLLGSLPAPWAVLTGAPHGPMWGACYEDGAGVVLPSTTPLDQVVETLSALGTRQTVVEPGERERLQEQWRALREERDRMSNRAGTLTPREREVLVLLYDGATVLEIARLLEVSPSTVRSQMKAIRRKLGVTSQLGAVAAYGALIRADPDEPIRSYSAVESSPVPH